MQGAQIVLVVCIAAGGCIPSLGEMAEPSTPVCSDTLWSVTFNNSYLEGQASIMFYIPTDEAGDEESAQFEATLSCEGLDVEGSRHQRFKKLPETLEFVVKMSLSENDTTVDDVSHSCTFEMASIDSSGQLDDTPVACLLTLRSTHGRILPSCNLDRSRTYIERTEVRSKEAQVHITFKESPNDVFTLDHGCRHGNILEHDRSATMLESRFSLPTPEPGQEAMLISVGFYPDCDNDTVRELYTHQRMDDCYLEVYSLCQEGEELIQTTIVQASDEAMLCPPAKTLPTKVMEHMALTLRIESKPVLVLILASFNTLILYLLLIPMMGIKCLYAKLTDNVRYLEVPKADPSSKVYTDLPQGNYVVHSEDEGTDQPQSKTDPEGHGTNPQGHGTNPQGHGAKQEIAPTENHSVSKASSSPEVTTPTPPDVHPPTLSQINTLHNVTQPPSPLKTTSRSIALLTSRYNEQGPRPSYGSRAGRLSSMPALAPPTVQDHQNNIPPPPQANAPSKPAH